MQFEFFLQPFYKFPRKLNTYRAKLFDVVCILCEVGGGKLKKKNTFGCTIAVG